jgi:hypothetical protein
MGVPEEIRWGGKGRKGKERKIGTVSWISVSSLYCHSPNWERKEREGRDNEGYFNYLHPPFTGSTQLYTTLLHNLHKDCYPITTP